MLMTAAFTQRLTKLTLQTNLCLLYLCRPSSNKAMAKAMFPPQKYDWFLVLDFEATCEKDTRLVPQEIIELPVLKVNGKSFDIESEFHEYVEPSVNKELTPFCTELTGIVQEMVDGQPHIEVTLDNLHKWMGDEGLLDPSTKSIFVTCGDWDLKTMLPSQSNYFGFKYANYLKKWINIKRSYADVTGQYPKQDMMGMLKGLTIRHKGRHHSGIDDTKNIAAILKELAARGHTYDMTGQL